MQVTPLTIDGTTVSLGSTGFQRLKLKYDELLSGFAFNLNQRPSIQVFFTGYGKMVMNCSSLGDFVGWCRLYTHCSILGLHA